MRDVVPIEPGVVRVTVDDTRGHICVEHTGVIAWETMQAIKCRVWGDDTVAVEIFPEASKVVNSGPYRHLWRLSKEEGAELPNLREESELIDQLAGVPDHGTRLIGESVHSSWMGRSDRDLLMRLEHAGFVEIVDGVVKKSLERLFTSSSLRRTVLMRTNKTESQHAHLYHSEIPRPHSD